MTEEAGRDKGRKRAYIALLRDDDEINEHESAVVVGDRVDVAAVTRSALLSGMAHTHGHASLPSELSSEEVRLWEMACSIECELSLDKLVTVLKVGDALGDEQCTTWVNKLAELAVATDWQQPHEADKMLCSLLSLSPHVLAQVLLRCVSQSSIDCLLGNFPAALHAAAVAAAVSGRHPVGTLSVQHQNAAAAMLTLTSTPIPSLHTLQLWPISTCIYPAALGALLARAAAAHPGLTRLFLSRPPVSAEWLRAFSAALPRGALPALADLSLCVESHPSGGADVFPCLTRLPALTTVSVGFNLAEDAAPSDISVSIFASITAARASLLNLQILKFEEGAGGESELDHVKRPSCAPSFLRLMSICAPAVTHLQVESRITRFPLQELLASIARFPALQQLHVDAALRAADAEHWAIASVSSSAELPPLKSIEVHSSCPMSAAAIATTIAYRACASLTQLTLSQHDEEEIDLYCDDACTAFVLTNIWRRFLSAVSCLTSLKRLGVDCLCGVPGGSVTEMSRVLALGLTRLKSLTGLSFKAGWAKNGLHLSANLDGSILGTAVATLTALQSLSFSDDVIDVELYARPIQPVLDACARLQRLETLTLRSEAVETEQVRTLLTSARALKTLELRALSVPDSESDDNALAELQQQFPGVSIAID